jgi:hypothetical protein
VAKSAVLEVEVTLTVHAQLEAEDATPEELRRFVEREPEMVRERRGEGHPAHVPRGGMAGRGPFGVRDGPVRS